MFGGYYSIYEGHTIRIAAPQGDYHGPHGAGGLEDKYERVSRVADTHGHSC